MGKRYPGLLFVSSMLRFVGVIVILAGLAGGLVWYFSLGVGEYSSLKLMVLVGVIVGSFVAGLTVYAQGDFYRCVMDIEENTRGERNEKEAFE